MKEVGVGLVEGAGGGVVLYLMEHEKVVVKRPHSFAEESLRQGTAYYDYENNANILPR